MSNKKGIIDSSRILELLPHRYPFLMVDRIIDVDGDESAVGIKNVTFNEPHFAGHYSPFRKNSDFFSKHLPARL